MTPALALFARTFLIGIAVAAPVGAIGVLCIQRTLERGVRAGLVTGLGVAAADAFYAGLAAFGVSALSEVLVAWQRPLQAVGGAVLVYMGVASLRRAPSGTAAGGGAADLAARSSYRSLFLSAVGLTLTNPMTIMAFGAVFASAGLVAAPGLPMALVATTGVASGSLSWWVVLVTGISLAHHALGDEFVVWVRRISGGVISAFGLLALYSAIR